MKFRSTPCNWNFATRIHYDNTKKKYTMQLCYIHRWQINTDKVAIQGKNKGTNKNKAVARASN